MKLTYIQLYDRESQAKSRGQSDPPVEELGRVNRHGWLLRQPSRERRLKRVLSERMKINTLHFISNSNNLEHLSLSQSSSVSQTSSFFKRLSFLNVVSIPQKFLIHHFTRFFESLRVYNWKTNDSCLCLKYVSIKSCKYIPIYNTPLTNVLNESYFFTERA